MSKADHLPLAVIEWSPARVQAYNPQTRTTYTGNSIADVAQHLRGFKEVLLSIGRRNSFVRTVRVPDVPKAQVGQVLKLQLGQHFPLPGAQLAYDFHLTGDVNHEGRLAVVGAVAADSLRELLRECRTAGLNVRATVPAAFASWLLARSLGELNCAVVEHTADGIAIDIVAENELRYTRVVPVPKDSASLEAEICRTFTVARVPCDRVIAAGGLSFEEADVTVTTRTIETLSSALVGSLDMNIELQEELEQRERKQIGSRARIAALLWVSTAAVLALVGFDYSAKTAKVGKQRKAYSAEIARLNSLKSGVVTKLNDQVAMRDTLVNSFEPAQRMQDVVKVVSADVPQGAWVSALTLERGKLMTLRGTSTSNEAVSTLTQRLSAEPRFRDVKLVFANNALIERVPVVQFSISAHVMGNFPVASNLIGGSK